MINFSFALLALVGMEHVNGHGYVHSPRSRNWFAVEEGVQGVDIVGLPDKEYCPDCLNTNELPNGICGKPAAGSSYTEYLDSDGNEMPWISQETYIAGQQITVKQTFTAHHYGHVFLSACDLGKQSKQDCFDNPNNWLEFVNDNFYNMPKDNSHPERGYLKRGFMEHEMVFKLPDNVSGDQVLIQWRYITANSCLPEGYHNYFNSFIGDPNYNVVTEDWKGPNMQNCDKYPQDGSKPDGGAPEQFWNCVEVTINPGTPTPPPVPTPPTPPPTASPVSTPAPVPIVPNPSGIPFPCCSWYSDFCEQPDNTWCHESKSNCEGSCSGVYRDPYSQPPPTPTGPNPTAPTPVPPTASPPTNIPTTGIPCCSINLKDCMSWCSSCHDSQAACESEGGQNTFWMPWGEPVNPDSCIAITYSCVGHGKPCCPGMICNPDSSSAPCIVDTSPPVSSPTLPPVSMAPVISPTSNPTANPTPSPTATPTVAPVVTPTSSPEGCYSKDYQNCLPEGYTPDNDTCELVWLPTGERTNCVSLWGKCSQNSDCCGESVCFGGDSCVPPSEDPDTLAPTPTPLTNPPTVACIICDDVETAWMASNGKDCTTSDLIGTKCNKNAQWTTNKFCRLSCFNGGNGYPGDVCCSN
mmetsp:Transcript_32272/g.47706  ORF Transcript_32272/g.47706 Transcript_32272/m.47706 type:complete len:635 (+) Transcript_32272:70-1974(+)